MKKIICAILAIVMCGFMAVSSAAPVMAGKCGDVDTAIFDCPEVGQNDKEGKAIWHIVKLVVDIMTIGVGILGVVGITITGIQYLTAGGSEEKTRKAKRRMFEIVIGLVAYVVIYAALYWLMPEFDKSMKQLENASSVITKILF